MYQLTGTGRKVVDDFDENGDDPNLTPHQQICLYWLLGDLGPKLMDRAIEAKIVDPLIPRALKQLLEKGLVEQLLPKEGKLKYCQNCHDNFYNGNNPLGIKECWHLDSSKVVSKEVYFSVHDVKPTRIVTLNCFEPEHTK